MQAQQILDVMHEITDARKRVADEYQKHMDETGNKPTLTIQNMLSWERSVRAEKAMYRMLALMPRQAFELELPETDNAESCVTLVEELGVAATSPELAAAPPELGVPIRALLLRASNELRILSFQVLYKIGKSKKRK